MLLYRHKYLLNNHIRKHSTNQLFALPFIVKRKQAENIYLTKNKLLEKKCNINKKSLIEAYIPFYSANISNLKLHVKGKYGIDRIKSNYDIVTDWYEFTYSLTSNYDFTMEDLQLYAGYKYPKKYVENVLRSKYIHNIIPFSDTMSFNKEGELIDVQKHEMTKENALEKITTIILDISEKQVINYIKTKYHADNFSYTLKLNFSKIKLINYYVPTYIYCNSENEKKMYKFVNGYTGNYNGQIDYSIMKSALFGSFIGTLLTPIIPISVIPIVKISICSIPIGILTGTFAKIYPYIKYKHDYYTMEKDRLYNQKTYKLNMNSINNLLIDKYKLLGLDPTKTITLIQLKTAYYREIKKFHPDVYIGNKTIGENITKDINEAYKTLENIIKQQI